MPNNTTNCSHIPCFGPFLPIRALKVLLYIHNISSCYSDHAEPILMYIAYKFFFFTSCCSSPTAIYQSSCWFFFIFFIFIFLISYAKYGNCYCPLLFHENAYTLLYTCYYVICMLFSNKEICL